MTQPLNISRNFAMVPEGTRRGNGDKKGLNIPEPVGNMTLTVPLDFLFRQRDAVCEHREQLLPCPENDGFYYALVRKSV